MYNSNYKGYYSIMLMALVEADYKFVLVNIGCSGSCSDAQFWNDCDLRHHIVTNRIGWPNPDNLMYDDREMPYYIISDEAFAQRTWLMKPFSKRHLDHEESNFTNVIKSQKRHGGCIWHTSQSSHNVKAETNNCRIYSARMCLPT